MGRLTVRLPETLHKELTALAKQEGVSLNQYIVYALTRQVTLADTIQAVPEEEVARRLASAKDPTFGRHVDRPSIASGCVTRQASSGRAGCAVEAGLPAC